MQPFNMQLNREIVSVTYIGFKVSRLIHQFLQSLATLENSLNVLCHDALHLLHLRLQCCDLLIATAAFLRESLLTHSTEYHCTLMPQIT